MVTLQDYGFSSLK